MCPYVCPAEIPRDSVPLTSILSRDLIPQLESHQGRQAVVVVKVTSPRLTRHGSHKVWVVGGGVLTVRYICFPLCVRRRLADFCNGNKKLQSDWKRNWGLVFCSHTANVDINCNPEVHHSRKGRLSGPVPFKQTLINLSAWQQLSLKLSRVPYFRSPVGLSHTTFWWHCLFKGTVSRDFSPPFIFIEQLHLGPW